MDTPDADVLAQPTGLMATAGNTQITLTWTDPGDASIFNYEYQQKEGSAAFGDWTNLGGGATTTSFRLTGLKNGTTYSYRIRARSGPELWPGLGRGHGHAAGGPARRARAHGHPAQRRRHPELAQPCRRQPSEMGVSIQDRHRGLWAVADRTGANRGGLPI